MPFYQVVFRPIWGNPPVFESSASFAYISETDPEFTRGLEWADPIYTVDPSDPTRILASFTSDLPIVEISDLVKNIEGGMIQSLDMMYEPGLFTEMINPTIEDMAPWFEVDPWMAMYMPKVPLIRLLEQRRIILPSTLKYDLNNTVDYEGLELLKFYNSTPEQLKEVLQIINENIPVGGLAPEGVIRVEEVNHNGENGLIFRFDSYI